MKTKTPIQKSGATPKALMEGLDVDFVSLVKQGANKQKFAMFKSKDGKIVPVNKNAAYDLAYTEGMGTSFTGAMDAIDTAEKLEESRNTLEESFFVLKMVIKGILEDNEVKDKSKGLKKAAGEFADFVGKLFDGISVQKASEMLNMEETNMKTTTTKSDESATSEVEKGSGNGVSANGDQAATDRKAPTTDVKGVSKKKKAQMKMLQAAIAKATASVEGLMAEDFEANQAKIEKAQTNIEKMETQLAELEKAVGDRSEGAPATGEDTVAKNGDEATSTTHEDEGGAETGDTSGAVAKGADANAEGGEAGAEGVKKDALGVETPTTGSAQDVNGKVGEVKETDGSMSAMFDGFMKQFEVSLDGKIAPMMDLIKSQGKKIEKLEKGTAKVDSLTKMAGLSNADDLDFEVSEEKVKTQKSEDAEWSTAISGNGSLKRSK